MPGSVQARFERLSRMRPWLVAMTWCLLAHVSYAASSITNPGEFLDQAESVRLKDHPRFIQMLAQIHHDAPQLSEDEQWHLRYLDAWEDMFNGKYVQSEGEFHEIIDRSADSILIAKASGMLLTNLAFNRRYEDAFALANHLASSLPTIKDLDSRYTLLTNLSQMLDFAGQTDLAVQYARMAEDAIPPD